MFRERLIRLDLVLAAARMPSNCGYGCGCGIHADNFLLGNVKYSILSRIFM